ncbi:MAG: Mur ligase family protein, partial [Kiritimatiellia bacterium]|nr:Mur ligase family protein [Kiritimatiellia bacterium]
MNPKPASPVLNRGSVTDRFPPAPAGGASSEELTLALFRRTAHGIRPGLDLIRRLLERRGHPETGLLCLHVAGTNGKGSVCAMIERLLRAAGLKTGLYTSPHLVSLHERIRIGGRPIEDRDLVELIRIWEAEALDLEQTESLRPATFFEITTAMAFDWFRREAVDVAVVETGMGGRWDATNVIVPAVATLCEIGMDHMEFLGSTLREIALEKTGIIKPGRPVVCGELDDEIRDLVVSEARATGAPLRRASDMVTLRRIRQDWTGQRIRIETASGLQVSAHLPLLGAHQLRNAALAVATLETFLECASLPLTEEILAEGLGGVC